MMEHPAAAAASSRAAEQQSRVLLIRYLQLAPTLRTQQQQSTVAQR